jgi:PAS domain S-box-containing protein
VDAPDDFLKPFAGSAGFDVQLALEAGEIGTWDWDLASGSMRWSLQMFRNTGVDPSASGDLYRHLLGAIHPTDRDHAVVAFEEFRRRPGPMRIEVSLVWPADERHWVVFLGKTIADGGVATRMIGITINSTRRRNDEETSAAALSESERRLRELNRKLQERAERRGRQLGASRAQMQAIFDNSPDWLTLFRATADGRFVYEDLNRATEEAYGLEYDQIVGHTVEEILGHEQAQLPVSHMRACIKTGENQRYTARRTLAGVTRSIDVMFVRVPEQQEGDYYIMSTARDTTERDEIEERLRQSQKMEAVGQLTGGLAHDFNNLLTAVIGNLELLAPRVADDTVVARYVGAARRSAENGAKLTGQLLAFSRLQHLQPRATDLNSVIEGMCDLLTRTIGPAFPVQLALAPDLWPALVDPTQIEVAILNLALNARDAMPLGGALTLETRNLSRTRALVPPEIDGKDCICIVVRDTGIGMTDDVARSAIEPFFTTKETGKGSGLGLSQVYGVVQQSNGAMRIETQPGEGTAIFIYLPRSMESADTVGSMDARALDQSAHADILLVDDNDEVRQVTEDMLREIGCTVTGVGSGEAALDVLARDDACDLLIIDIAMPGLNGIETVARARALRPELRVLYITGYADFEGIHRTQGDLLIKKPFHLSELAIAIRRSVSDRSLAQNTTAS